MTVEQWVNGPVGRGAEYRVIRGGCRTVLVVVPFVGVGTRLLDVLPLIEADHRILTVFTVVPTANGARPHGTEEFLRANACMVLPWQQAIQYEFDLVLAASPNGVAQLHGNLLMLPHGAGSVRPMVRSRSAGAAAAPTHALDREFLMSRGRLLPAVVALAHDAELDVLASSCPEAMAAAVVAGDICYDRLLASIPYRAEYRRVFGVAPAQQLVVVTSTWQPESTVGSWPEILDRLVAELPPEQYRVAAIMHPNIWHVHGGFQVRSWFADALRGGLALVPPEEGWRGALIAADLLIGDHGSVTRYGAAIGLPTMVAALAEEGLRADPAIEALRRNAPRLCRSQPLVGQIRAAVRQDQSWQDALLPSISTRPGEAGQILRRAMYELLGLDEPSRAIPCSPVPLPRPVFGESLWWKDDGNV